MKQKLNKDKLITISLLPAMWLIYFLFEIFTGRVKDLYTLTLNLSLIFVFAFTGWIIYYSFEKNSKGLSFKNLSILFIILMIIDQGGKIIIKFFFFHKYFEIIPNFLSFNPIINSEGSWLNARFGFGVSFPILILVNALALFLFVELYRYYLNKGNEGFWSDMCFIFIFTGALCSLIDKVFYGGSLDFIGISNLFVADIKDIYINIGILFFIMCIYTSGYLSDNEDTTLKEDLQGIKKFLSFVKKDIFKL
ncbi:MAG: signal peptidase II [Clostridium septicum]|uniref:signal peptidase II n=1 Tax=Clostridium septicum TaxID=1504 RepID=UPI00258E7DE2|nr:signal peptidase II [Clostridium septicum]MDU1315362.1 signal peptidase II [Clostridium septicum]WLF69321.1 signal peptidase II [Clostridium septicum]